MHAGAGLFAGLAVGFLIVYAAVVAVLTTKTLPESKVNSDVQRIRTISKLHALRGQNSRIPHLACWYHCEGPTSAVKMGHTHAREDDVNMEATKG